MNHRTHRMRLRIMPAVGLLALAMTTPAGAQTSSRQSFQLQAQPLADALRAFGRQSGREIIFPADAVRGKTAPKLDGSYRLDEAIALLLDGSGLSAEISKGTVYIRGRRQAPIALASRPAESGDIVVTGTRIHGAPPTSPVISQSRNQIEDAGLTDLGSLARSLPQNFTGGQNPGVIGGGNQGDNINLNSSTNLNLRGLGPDATLTLVNGHRVAYDALNQGVDISAIPLAAVERVEIVADGSSALYGSDAVGGVANIILRRDFDGLETSARFGGASGGGFMQEQYSGVTGSKWRTGGFMTAVDFSRSTDVTARQRSFAKPLDDSATLYPAIKQISIVAAGHQELFAGAVFEIDAQFNRRKSGLNNPFFETGSVFIDGLAARTEVSSFSVTPTLRFSLPHRWNLSLSGTHGTSNTDIRSTRYLDGDEAARTRLRYDNQTDAAELNAEGPLFMLPGGEVRAAVGGGFRSIRLDTKISTLAGGFTTVTNDLSPHRDNYYGYGEISIPLVSPDNDIAFVNLLRLMGAVRYEKYKGVGDLATPKLGLLFAPIEAVSLKGSWGKSFKAPTLFQEYQARQGLLLPPFAFRNNPDGITALYLAGGGGPLRPERATTWNVTATVRPHALERLSVEASYFDVRYKDRIVSPIGSISRSLNNPIYADLINYDPTVQQVLDIVSGLPEGLSNQTGGPFNPAAVGAIIDSTLQNVARQHARGVDIAVGYGFEPAPGDKVDLMADASYLKSDRQLSSGQPTIRLAGTIFDPPHWRARMGGTWTRANGSLSAFANYVGGNSDDRQQPAAHVGSYTSVDLVAGLKATAASGIFRGFEARLAVTNVFNERPDRIENSDLADPPYDSANYSALGRTLSITLKKTW